LNAENCDKRSKSDFALWKKSKDHGEVRIEVMYGAWVVDDDYDYDYFNDSDDDL